MIPSEENSSCTLVEICKSIDWKVFFLEVLGDDSSLSFSDNWEDVWFSILRSVGTDSKVDLVWVLAVFVSDREGENWVSWSLVDVVELLVAEFSGFLGLELRVENCKSIHCKIL